MYFKLIGVEHKNGTYEGTDYDNYNLFVTENIESDKGIGEKVTIVKVKSANTASVFNVPFTTENMSKAIGQPVNISFDRYGRADTIILNAK